jgi:hypothetical protein
MAGQADSGITATRLNVTPPHFDGVFGVQGLPPHNAPSRHDKAADWSIACYQHMQRAACPVRGRHG